MRSIILAVIAALAVTFGASAFMGQPTIMGSSGGSSSGVVCDFGPNFTGTLPADVTTAGFTHCALNADFTDNSSTTVSGGWIMNQPNTWLNQCKGSSTWGLFWLMNGVVDIPNNDSGGNVACNRVSMVTDGASNVLSFNYTSADQVLTPTPTLTGFGLYWPLCGNSCNTSILKPALSNAYYVEYTYRLSAGVTQTNSNIIQALDNMSVFDGDSGVGASGNYLDFPTLEALANNNSSTAWAMDVYSGSCSGGKCGVGFTLAPDLGNFHTIATLTTTDSSPAMAICWYQDGTRITNYSGTLNFGATFDGNGCTHVSHFVADEMNAHDRRVYIAIGSQLGPINTITIHIKSIRVFTCANYKGFNNNCVGTVVFH